MHTRSLTATATGDAHTSPVKLKRVPFTAPSPIKTPSSLSYARRVLDKEEQARRRRRLRRKPLKPDTKCPVGNKFLVTPDIAPLCTNKQLHQFVHEASTNRVSCEVKEGASVCRQTRPPKIRLFLHLGALTLRDGQPAFLAHVNRRFVDVLLSRLQESPAWESQTRRCTERFDFFFGNGMVAQTLFKPQNPFLSHRVVMSQPDRAMMMSLHQPMGEFPTHVRFQQVNEVECEVQSLKTSLVQRVEVRHVHAFSSKAWVYRVMKMWHGSSLDEALKARQLSAPKIEVSLELQHGLYTSIHDLPFTVASCLLRVRDLVNCSVLFAENARFHPRVQQWPPKCVRDAVDKGKEGGACVVEPPG